MNMKKLKICSMLMLMAMVASLSLLAACGSDDDEELIPPAIDIRMSLDKLYGIAKFGYQGYYLNSRTPIKYCIFGVYDFYGDFENDIEITDDWIHIEKGEHTNEYILTVDENTSYNDRSGKIVFHQISIEELREKLNFPSNGVIKVVDEKLEIQVLQYGMTPLNY